MSSVPTQVSSGSEGSPRDAVVDLRRTKRKLSNRESARRSRQKKQQHLQQLENQLAHLKEENSRILVQINMLTPKYISVDSDNGILRTQVAELTERLQSLSSVLRFVEDFSGVLMDIPGMPESLLEPWQLPCPTQPIMASTDMFQL